MSKLSEAQDEIVGSITRDGDVHTFENSVPTQIIGRPPIHVSEIPLIHVSEIIILSRIILISFPRENVLIPPWISPSNGN